MKHLHMRICSSAHPVVAYKVSADKQTKTIRLEPSRHYRDGNPNSVTRYIADLSRTPACQYARYSVFAIEYSLSKMDLLNNPNLLQDNTLNEYRDALMASPAHRIVRHTHIIIYSDIPDNICTSMTKIPKKASISVLGSKNPRRALDPRILNYVTCQLYLHRLAPNPLRIPEIDFHALRMTLRSLELYKGQDATYQRIRSEVIKTGYVIEIPYEDETSACKRSSAD